jgi:23S rRNA-/tRNA-specific pseudouridylate synthase
MTKLERMLAKDGLYIGGHRGWSTKYPENTLLAVKEADETCPIPRSLVRVHLETGRTHQIRAQFAARRLPLLGDARYGANMRTPLGLFAAGLTLSHPISGTEMTFSAPFEKLFPFSIFYKNE